MTRTPWSRGALLARAALTMRAKLFVVLAAVAAVGLGNALVYSRSAAERAAAFGEVEHALERQAVLIENLGRLRDLHRAIQLLGDMTEPETGTPPADAERFHGAARAITEAFARLPGSGDSVSQRLEAAVRRDVDRLLDAWRTFYRLSATDVGGAIAVLGVTADGLAADVLGSRLPALIRYEQDQARRASARFAAIGRITARVTVALLVVSTVIACGLVLLLGRDLMEGVRALGAGAERVGAGEFEYRLGLARRDELGDVARSFDHMTERLQHAHAQLEQRNAELADALQQLRDAQTQLVQQEKMAAVGTMLAGVAHEINNPLAGIVACAQVLEQIVRRRGNDAELSRFIDLIVREAMRVGTLVKTLLQFSRQSQPILEPVNVAEAVAVAVRLREYAFRGDNLALTTDVPSTLWGYAEAQRLQQVVVNIVNNAYEALRERGNGALLIRGRRDGSKVVLTFEDDGPGLSEPERVFDPFYTTKPAGAGTGLGLSLAQRFVAECGGILYAANLPGGGAVFTVRLRAARPSGETAVPADANETAGHLEGVRVLLVEDEEAVRVALVAALTERGGTVAAVAGALEGRKALEREDYDVVICDVRMPGPMDGLDLYEWIRHAKPHLAERVVMITGAVEAVRTDSVLGELRDRVFTKPFDVERLVERVRRMRRATRGPESVRDLADLFRSARR